MVRYTDWTRMSNVPLVRRQFQRTFFQGTPSVFLHSDAMATSRVVASHQLIGRITSQHTSPHFVELVYCSYFLHGSFVTSGHRSALSFPGVLWRMAKRHWSANCNWRAAVCLPPGIHKPMRKKQRTEPPLMSNGTWWVIGIMRQRIKVGCVGHVSDGIHSSS